MSGDSVWKKQGKDGGGGVTEWTDNPREGVDSFWSWVPGIWGHLFCPLVTYVWTFPQWKATLKIVWVYVKDSTLRGEYIRGKSSKTEESRSEVVICQGKHFKVQEQI